MDHAHPDFDALLAATRDIARGVAATHAPAVDRDARFPTETIEALRHARVLSAAVPQALGGAGCSLRELGQLCHQIGQACGSSAMVLAMHYIQVGCLARHHADSPVLTAYLRELCERQWLLASITSEVGTFGDTRSSLCALQREGDRFRLDKEATTGSYCAHADAILVTTRRDEAAAQSDQLLVLVKRADCSLTQTTTWDTMGMRGTCSPGFSLRASGPMAQVLPVDYADIFTQTMVPYSHILWASLWTGIAAGAYGKAAGYVRGLARKAPGTVPPVATDLAELNVALDTMRHHWQALAEEFDRAAAAGRDAEEFNTLGWSLKMTGLKTACSEAAPRVVHGALQIVGLLGYKNDSPLSLSREYRDALSASLMISNKRIAAKSAAMLLVHKAD